MNKDNFKKAKEEIRRVSLSAAEKRAMITNITGTDLAAAASAPRRGMKTPYSFAYFFAGRKSVSVIFALLILVLAGGGISSASQNALPGGPLYAFKVRVIEPVRVALASSAADRARIQSELAMTRLAEAETLVVDHELDIPKLQEIKELLSEHTTALADSLSEVDRASPVEATDIGVNFKAGMDAHARVLDMIAANAAASSSPLSTAPTAPAATKPPAGSAPNAPTSSASSSAPSASAPSVSVPSPSSLPTLPPEATSTEPSVLIVPAGTSTPAGESASVAEFARNAADRILDNGRLQQEKAISTDAEFGQLRDSVQSLIQKNSDAIANTGTSTGPSVRQQMTDQAKQILGIAAQFLGQADQQYSAGDNSAHASLVKAWKSAREADILLHRGAGWNR